MGFDAKAAEAVGLAVGVWAVVWLGFRFVWRKAEKPPGISLQLFAIALGLWIAGSVFYSGREWLGHIGALLIVAGAVFGWVLLDRIIHMVWLAKKENAGMPMILRQLCGALVVLIAAASVMKWGYRLELTGLLATSGIAAVILGFAMQDLLSNVIAGFSIHTTGAYKVGDWLLMADGDKRAEVTEINWRSTRLVDNDRISYELPNSEIVKNRIVNLNRPGAEHGVRLQFGLDYDTPPALAKEVLLKAAKGAQGVLDAPGPIVFTREFGDSSVTYELRIWMRHARLYNITCDEIRTALWYELGRRNMRIPFPIRTLDKRRHNVPDAIVSSRGRAAEILRGCTALDCLTEAEADRLVENGKLLVFGPREPLVTRGETGESMFVVLEGSVEVIGRTQDGARVVLASLGVGECFGEMSLVTGEPRNATVRAKGDVLVLEIRKGDLSPLMSENPELAERLGQLLEARRKDRSESLDRAGEGTAPIGSGEQSGRSLARRIRAFFA